MSASIDAMIKDGVRLYKAGKKAEARAIWEKVTELDQYSEQAWLWLSAVVETPDDQRTCLENVLFINPNNTNAKKGLETLNAKSSPPPVPPAPTPPVKASPSKPVAPPETSVSYDPPTATSSASSAFVPDETPPEIYDDWIGSLNLGGSNKPGSTSAGPFSSTPAFDDDSFGDDSFDNFSFGDDDDDDNSNPAQQVRAFMDSSSSSDSYDDDFDDPFSDDPFADSSLTSGPFSAAALNDDDDEPIGRRSTTASRPAAQPARRDTSPSRKSTSAVGNASRSFIGDNVQPLDEPDPGEYFAMIPATIRSTRLPGTDEKHPTLVRILLYLLILLNLGAVGLLAMQLMG